MILLDTNVVSAAVVNDNNASVSSWMNGQDEGLLFICAPVLAELRYGAQLLPDGRRKARISAIYDEVEQRLFAGRILPFDAAAAHQYAIARASRQRAGRPMQPMDTLIAAIALANSMTLATRNTKDFEDLGLTLINPFEAPAP